MKDIPWRKLAFVAVVVVALAVAAGLMFLGIGASAETIDDSKRLGFTEINLSNGDSDWHRLSGDNRCIIWGTFDSASAKVEKLIQGTRVAPVFISDVSVLALLGVTTNTDLVLLGDGVGDYRLVVSSGLGSESINWQCRRVGQ